MRKHNGLSLIEMMLSLFLASVLLEALMGHYLIVKQQYYRAQDLLEQALELDWVDDLIRESVQRAGFTPCMGLSWLKTIDSRNGKKLKAMEVRHPQSLLTYRMNELFNSVLRYDKKSVTIDGNYSYKRKQAVLIADCFHAEVKEITAIQHNKDGQTIGLKTPLLFKYIEPIYFGEWVEEHFFIHKNNSGKNALYYQREHAEELTPAINNLSATIHSRQKMMTQILLTLTSGETVEIEAAARTS